jgi:hypothetical protein
VRKVLVALCLLVFSGTILQAQPGSKGSKGSPRVARPAAVSPARLSPRERIWQRLFGVHTFDDPPSEPPPPDRSNNPIPT